MNLGLDGKVALVTGGARDVGRSIALALAGEGAAVAVNYLKSDADAWALVEEIRQLGGLLGWIETSHVDREWLAANREKIVSAYAIRRLGKPDDVGPFVAFLASDHAGWVTGQVISVSGGYSTFG
jgi:NAD(P)-dependent dehydrogenase (short-subunit alcohol dehydrogenase family)